MSNHPLSEEGALALGILFHDVVTGRREVAQAPQLFWESLEADRLKCEELMESLDLCRAQIDELLPESCKNPYGESHTLAALTDAIEALVWFVAVRGVGYGAKAMEQ